jgi:hypothetical protein
MRFHSASHSGSHRFFDPDNKIGSSPDIVAHGKDLRRIGSRSFCFYLESDHPSIVRVQKGLSDVIETIHISVMFRVVLIRLARASYAFKYERHKIFRRSRLVLIVKVLITAEVKLLLGET